jgi:hypothetical protein
MYTCSPCIYSIPKISFRIVSVYVKKCHFALCQLHTKLGCKMYCMVNAVFYPYTHSLIPNISIHEQFHSAYYQYMYSFIPRVILTCMYSFIPRIIHIVHVQFHSAYNSYVYSFIPLKYYPYMYNFIPRIIHT